MALSVLLAAAIIAGRFSHVERHLDILCHFQMQYLVVAIVLTVALLATRRWKWALLPMACVVMTTTNVLPWYWPPQSLAITDQSPRLRVMIFNILQTNDRYQDVIEHVRENDPDLVVFHEADETWFEQLQPLRTVLRHAHHQPGGQLRGMAVFSRVELLDVQRRDFNNPISPSCSFAVEVGGVRVEALATHPWPPVSDAAFESRQEQMQFIGEFVAGLSPPCILMGDLNTSMWSRDYRELERLSGLRNARKGHGIRPTHPTDHLSFLRVPIDHCLVSDEIAVLDCRVGDPCGSDHAPLIVDLAIAK